MRKTHIFSGLVACLLLISSWSIKAQDREIGGGLSGMFYTGDMARGVVFNLIRPAGTIFLRNNFNEHTSIRIGFTGGLLQGNDRKPVDAFARARDADFSIFISEFAANLEYYFLDYKGKRAVVNWSPYLHGGIAVFGMSGHDNKNATYSNVQIAIPIGIGFRYQLDRRWSVSAEYGVRAAFFDYLDNISAGDIYDKNYQYGNVFNNDQYHTFGFNVSYTFYKVVCPTLPLKQGYRR